MELGQGTDLSRHRRRSCRVFASLFGAVLCLAARPVEAQSDGGLEGADERMLVSLVQKFQPLPTVERIWQGAFLSASDRTRALKARIDSIERSGMDEAEVLVQVGGLRTELRTIRTDRNAFISGFLSPLEQLALDSILNPPAPSIQHFGFHDRLKCLVCKSPSEGAMFPQGIRSPDQLILPKQ